MGQLVIKIQGQFEISRKKCHNFLLTTPFCMNESFPCRKLHKKSARNSKLWVCQRLPKKASDPNWAARNFRG
jgi:hypothetical protein